MGFGTVASRAGSVAERSRQGVGDRAPEITLFFSTVVRAAPLLRGGELVRLDWKRKQVLRRTPMAPLDSSLRDGNPRGNARGGRGIWVTPESVLAAAYDGIKIFDHDLNQQREVSNGLLAGLHEVLMTAPGRLWVTATALDAALEIELENGSAARAYWPREVPAFQEAFGVRPATIDKTDDQRAAFLGRYSAQYPGHLHLNAVARWRGATLALLNRFGAVVDLDQHAVVVHDDALRGAHNLVVCGDTVVICATHDRSVRIYDLSSGRLERVYSLSDYEVIAAASPAPRPGRRLAHRQARAAPPVLATPLFVRGLDVLPGLLFVGYSPASIACIDVGTGELIDHYRYSDDIRVCVHGLRVSTSGPR